MEHVRDELREADLREVFEQIEQLRRQVHELRGAVKQLRDRLEHD